MSGLPVFLKGANFGTILVISVSHHSCSLLHSLSLSHTLVQTHTHTHVRAVALGDIFLLAEGSEGCAAVNASVPLSSGVCSRSHCVGN